MPVKTSCLESPIHGKILIYPGKLGKLSKNNKISH